MVVVVAILLARARDSSSLIDMVARMERPLPRDAAASPPTTQKIIVDLTKRPKSRPGTRGSSRGRARPRAPRRRRPRRATARSRRTTWRTFSSFAYFDWNGRSRASCLVGTQPRTADGESASPRSRARTARATAGTRAARGCARSTPRRRRARDSSAPPAAVSVVPTRHSSTPAGTMLEPHEPAADARGRHRRRRRRARASTSARNHSATSPIFTTCAAGQRHPALHARAVDERAVAAAEVAHGPARRRSCFELGVLARHRAREHDELAFVVAADRGLRGERVRRAEAVDDPRDSARWHRRCCARARRSGPRTARPLARTRDTALPPRPSHHSTGNPSPPIVSARVRSGASRPSPRTSTGTRRRPSMYAAHHGPRRSTITTLPPGANCRSDPSERIGERKLVERAHRDRDVEPAR